MADAKTIEMIKNELSRLLNALEFPFSKLEVVEEKNGIVRANIDTERAPFLIGTFGERVNALQHLLKNILWKKIDEKIFLVVDVDHYRKSREEKMMALAEEKIAAAAETKIPQKMPVLEPYLRRMIHLFIAEKNPDGVTSESRGEGDERRLFVIPKN